MFDFSETINTVEKYHILHMINTVITFQCYNPFTRLIHNCHYFPIITVQAFKISHSEDEILKLDSNSAREIIYTELTMSEFAEALSMPAESEFVRKVNYQYKSIKVKL
jgi:hypothetical protein